MPHLALILTLTLAPLILEDLESQSTQVTRTAAAGSHDIDKCRLKWKCLSLEESLDVFIEI